MVAIMLACASKSIKLLGVTTVAGNQEGHKTFENALRVLTLINRGDIPVARGADKPLLRDLIIAPEIHGSSGLDGAELPLPGVEPWPGHALDLLEKLILESPEKVTLVPTGPLTNIALLFLKNPAIKERIEQIVLMGGAALDSNFTPAAEFNIFVDPEAADVVFSAGLPLTMVGLDVTNKAVMTFSEIEELARLGGPVSSVAAPLLEFFAQANKDVFGIEGAPIHDALAVASVIDPSLLKAGHHHVAIETQGTHTRGRTVVDLYNITGEEPNVAVALEVNTPAFIAMLRRAFITLDEAVQGKG
ncbi:pyrimidine-specific ribonucleoside hydrolase [Alkalispirochaeta americana]|uniref:Pyrimidine-specific ribonucleoside hydrolase n=2 Tax=Alkalispirochaeta americana TaxID=159291 RepID=A0A1N6PV64_9SPIO|nr:pyrimidine-specific ribonucleoside hydrolase [Alkalispirochaeta americana]